MKLETANGRSVTRAESNDILNALQGLNNEENSFMRIGGVDYYLKAVKNGSGMYLEYLDASGMFRSKDGNLDSDTALAICTSYSRGRDTWKSKLEWDDVSDEIPQPEERGGGIVGMLKSMFKKDK